MEPKFSTSFIPKQTLAETTAYKQAPRRSAPKGVLSLVLVISFVVCAGSAALAAFVFFNMQVLENSLTAKREQLMKAKEAFQPELIREMTNLDKRLILAKALLENHVAPSEIFSALQEFTLQTIQFTSFNYSIDGGGVQIGMSGKARSFSSIALQTDEFVQSRIILNPVFSNFVLGDDGEVNFTFTGTLNRDFISYSRVLESKAAVTETQTQ